MSPAAAVREFFVQEGALRAAQAYDARQLETVQALVRAAKRRRSAARAGFTAWTEPASAVLMREAVSLYLRAARAAEVAASGSAGEAIDLGAIWSQLCEAQGAPEGAPLVRAALESAAPLFFDRLSARELAANRRALDQAARWLGARVESRSPLGVRVTRGCRLAAVAVVVLYAVFAFVRAKTAGPPNLATGKPVVASSPHPATTADPKNLADGHYARAFAFHTKAEDKPWVQIDLGEVHALRRVVVHNRGDGWLDANLPLALEVSENGSAYDEIARKEDMFEPGHPWVAELHGERARFVRLQVMRHSALALAGVEVYGDP